MIHPLLTLLFDLILIGTASAVIAAMVAECLADREPAIGSTRPRARVARDGVYARQRTVAHQRRRAATREAGQTRRAP
jgi:hypothetical protein